MTDEELCHYSRALDEVYALRSLLAYEAGVLEAHLDYKSFPKSRRPVAEAQVERMRMSAKGAAGDVYRNTNSRSLRAVQEYLGIETLTRHKFEQEAS